MKAILQNRAKWALIVSPILIALGLIFAYGAIAKTKSGETREAASGSSLGTPKTDPTPCQHSDFAENAEAAREYRNGFGVNGNLAPGVYAKAVAAARALPPSPLLKGRTFTPRIPNPPWRSVPAPINTNNGDYGFSASPRVQAVAVDPSDSNTVYTGSWGGLAKSTNAGNSWEYRSDSWSSQAVSAIAIDPNAPASVFVGTGVEDPAFGAGLYRSTDGGAHWDNIGLSEFGQSLVRTVVIDPQPLESGQTTIYVTNGFSSNEECGLWRSTDSGSNWTRLSFGTNIGAYDVAIDASTRPSTVYVSLPSGVYRVVDDSQKKWERIYDATWSDPKMGKLSVVDAVLYLLDPGTEQHTLFKLDTQCQNCDWTEIPTLCTNTEMHCAAGQPLAPNIFAVDPTNPATILIDQSFQSTGHGPNRLFRTVDGGSHWTEVGRCTIHVDQRAFAFTSDYSGVVYEGNDGGVVRSADHGETWHNLNDNFPGALTYGVALSRDDSLIGGTQDCGVLFSDPGAPWDMIQGGDSSQNLIDPSESDISYYTTLTSKEFRRYKRSTDSWTNITPNNPAFGSNEPCLPVFSMNPLIPEHVIAACQQVMRTLVATATPTPSWTKVGSTAIATGNRVVSAVCEAPSDPDVLYAVVLLPGHGGDSVFVKTAGVDWLLLPNATQGPDVNAVAVDPTQPGTVYLARTSRLYRSTNFGVSWSAVTGVPADLNYTAMTIDPTNPELIFAASNGGIFASFNGVNNTWTEISAGIPQGMHIFALSFNQFSRQLAAATFGRGVYLLDLDDVAPEVAMTAPAYGATVSGTVTVSADASDNHRIAGVQFRLDGDNLGDEDTSYPYSIQWDTTGLGGNHILSAVARDPANNTTTSGEIKITVNDLKR